MRNVSLFLGLVSLSFSSWSFSQDKNYPCSGAPGVYRINPDDSQGGFVTHYKLSEMMKAYEVFENASKEKAMKVYICSDDQ